MWPVLPTAFQSVTIAFVEAEGVVLNSSAVRWSGPGDLCGFSVVSAVFTSVSKECGT